MHPIVLISLHALHHVSRFDGGTHSLSSRFGHNPGFEYRALDLNLKEFGRILPKNHSFHFSVCRPKPSKTEPLL